MIAVIAGTTGLVGGHLLSKLLNNNRFDKIISLTRKSVGINHEKLHEVILEDFANIANVADSLNGDHYFCALGTTIKQAGSQQAFKSIDHDAVLAFAKIAKQFQAQSFSVISALGADSLSYFFYSRTKGDMERELSALGLNQCLIFQPGLLIGQRPSARFAETFGLKIINMLTYVLPSRIIKHYATPADKLAEKMITMSTQSQAPLKFISSDDI